MAKFAYVVTKWIGAGTPDDPQRPEIGELVGYCEDVTGQFVNLAKGSPDPNLVVCKVGELRSPKHDGQIDTLKSDSRFLVLEEWEEGEEPKPHATDAQVKRFLKKRKVKDHLADEVKGERRALKAIRMTKAFERRESE